ncbi:MAG: MFS transporter [Acidimicrobiales bacterium]
MTEPVLRRFVTAHLLTVIGEWAATVGVLVHAYAWGGTTAVGIVSLCVLAPSIVGAPLAAAIVVRRSASAVRLASFALQASSFGGAALVVALDGPGPLAVALVVVGLGTVSTLRPTAAVVLPAVVRTTRDLTTVNLAVSYCDSASALVGPIVAAALAGAGGPTAVFVGCAVGAAVSFGATAWRAPRTPVPPRGERPRRVMRSALAELRRRPWSIGVLGVASARNLVIGAFDVVLVVIALDSLDLGDGGPGLLTALVGAGAIASTVMTTVVVRRRRLSPALLAGLAVTAALCGLLGAWLVTPVAVVVLPLMGVCLSSMDNLSRILLQRSTDPRHLGPLFAAVGLVAGLGQLLGSVIAQVALALGGPHAALLATGAALAVVLVSTGRSLRDADQHADVPVVEMSLLAGLPMFSPLPPASLEAVARSTSQHDVAAGTDVIRQGEAGDVFYVVADGEFDVVQSGRLVRTARRGSFFGEVALLAEVPRTATVTARTAGALLEVRRDPFLVAVVGHEAARAVASAHVLGLRDDLELDEVHIVGIDSLPPAT